VKVETGLLQRQLERSGKVKAKRGSNRSRARETGNRRTHQNDRTRVLIVRAAVKREPPASRRGDRPQSNLHCSLEVQMGDEGTQRRIFDRSHPNDIQFAVRRENNADDAIDPFPLRERRALNVVGRGLCRLVNRVRAISYQKLSSPVFHRLGAVFSAVGGVDVPCGKVSG
jgi:hypothetical protein